MDSPANLLFCVCGASSKYHIEGTVTRQESGGNPLHPGHARAQIFQGSGVTRG